MGGEEFHLTRFNPSQSSAPTTRRSFALYWCARVLSSFAFQMSAVAIGWLIYDRTDSAYSLGLIGLAQFVPMVVLTPLVGHLADRYDRRLLVLLAQFIQGAALVFILAGMAGGWLSTAHIYLAVAVLGAGRALAQPAMTALLPNLVTRTELARAIALSSTANQVAVVAGPALGGLLYAWGATAPLAFAAAFNLCAGILAVATRLAEAPAPREPGDWRAAFAGVAYIWRRPILLGAVSLDLFAVLLGGATALLPIYARDILGTGPWGLGLLRSAPAVGALTMSVVLSRMRLTRDVGKLMFGAVIIFGAATIVFALSRSMALSLAALAVTGGADNVSVVIRSSLVQLSVPDEMRGRVSAVNSLFIGTSNLLGEFESGMVAGLLGAVPSAALGGIGTILIALIWTRLFPPLRKVESLSG
jgi:MFS family permease